MVQGQGALSLEHKHMLVILGHSPERTDNVLRKTDTVRDQVEAQEEPYTALCISALRVAGRAV